ncbi:MAG: hydroxymethylglutaryl-CoA synthase [Deltaproteobacteria bacterium]|nr:hydroxymethylglutaryl-CoA synthase [Deltaproteobacteria bacterium]
MQSPHGVGIEAISVCVPRYWLPLTALAEANGVEPAKYAVGLGVEGMAVTHPNEDAVTMAVEASDALLKRYDIDRHSIGLLVVGSETGVDAAKPIAAYVHGLLGLPFACRTLDTKHACYSATAALALARDWCAGSGRGRKALIIATDIARYEVGSAGEPTQGAGAVAMLVGDHPSVFVFEPYREAFFARHVMDFWRPHYRSTAIVDGPASVESYLAALESTYADFERHSGLGWDDFEYLLFHVPFPKMACKAFKLLYEREVARRNGSGMTQALGEAFESRTVPSLWPNRAMGNLYSGSLYASLAGLLERGDGSVEGARAGLFSYGSGCCGEFFSGRVGPDAAAWRGKIDIAGQIKRRTRLDYTGYISFREQSARLAEEGSHTGGAVPGGHFGRVAFLGIKDHQRVYESSPRPAVSDTPFLPAYNASAHTGK